MTTYAEVTLKNGDKFRITKGKPVLNVQDTYDIKAKEVQGSRKGWYLVSRQFSLADAQQYLNRLVELHNK